MRTAVLLSGRGSNLRALVEAARAGQIAATVDLVLSNVRDAPGLAWAREQGLAVEARPHQDFGSREEHDRAMVELLQQHRIELVCLAGYMRRLSRDFVRAYPERILNIHPALLPSFPGLEAQAQALRWGVKIAGATVHFVDEELDHGPIVAQEAVPVLPADTVDSLSERILAAEHRLYPRAVGLLAAGRIHVDGRVATELEANP